jgi:thiol-disulfide isomerase/thioredoxin
MKKLLILFAVLVLGLVSCANNEQAVENTANNAPVQTETVPEKAVETPDATVEASETETESSPGEIAKDKLIPNFDFNLLTGETVNLHDYKGKIIMLNFWTTWCTYCDKEMPDLEIVSQYEDVEVFAINSRESISTVSKYVDEGGFTFHVVLDEIGYFSDLFYITSLPTTFFIDENGILLGAVPGMMTLEQMEGIIQDIRDDEL